MATSAVSCVDVASRALTAPRTTRWSGRMTSSLEGKARKNVVRPTPARSAMSSTVECSYPRSSNSSYAAAVSLSLTDGVAIVTTLRRFDGLPRLYGTEYLSYCIQYLTWPGGHP